MTKITLKKTISAACCCVAIAIYLFVLAHMRQTETVGSIRLFRGDATKQLQQDGHKADPKLWYWEPVDYEGDVLWSKGVGSRAEAYRAAGLPGLAK